jgi:hypothetical protein
MAWHQRMTVIDPSRAQSKWSEWSTSTCLRSLAKLPAYENSVKGGGCMVECAAMLSRSVVRSPNVSRYAQLPQLSLDDIKQQHWKSNETELFSDEITFKIVQIVNNMY